MERLDVADDLPDDSEDTWFRRHNRFLDMMRKYRCRILFTTCSQYDKHISLEPGESQRAYSELAEPVKERNFNQCMDNGSITYQKGGESGAKE